MSRAFVREQDVPAVEPLPEIAVSTSPNWVTAEGMALIDSKLSEIDRDLANASDEDSMRLHRDKRYWVARKGTAQLIPPPNQGSDVVAFGSRVKIQRGDLQPQVLRIVGEDEADPANGSVSFAAPIGHALMGKRAGDVLTVGPRVPPIEIEILAVDNR